MIIAERAQWPSLKNCVTRHKLRKHRRAHRPMIWGPSKFGNSLYWSFSVSRSDDENQDLECRVWCPLSFNQSLNCQNISYTLQHFHHNSLLPYESWKTNYCISRVTEDYVEPSWWGHSCGALVKGRLFRVLRAFVPKRDSQLKNLRFPNNGCTRITIQTVMAVRWITQRRGLPK